MSASVMAEVDQRVVSDESSSCSHQPVLAEAFLKKDDHCSAAPGTTRRSSSIGVSLMTNYDDISPPLYGDRQSFASNSSLAIESIPQNHGQFTNMRDDRHHQYRPLVGSGSAAAYEASRHDFYVQKHRKQQQRRMSSLSFGSANAQYSGRPANPEEYVIRWCIFSLHK